MITFKSIDIFLASFTKPWHPNLVKVMKSFEARQRLYEADSAMTITETYRPQLRPNDLHSTDLLRAIDLRSWIYYTPAKLIEIDFNKLWIYDPDRPEMKVLIYHDTGRGPHFHLQVHPNTILRSVYDAR